MSIRFKAIAIAFVAAPATLFGHSLTYALGALSVTDGRHNYLLPALQALVTIALAVGLALILRSLLTGRTGSRRGRSCAQLGRSTCAWSEFLGLWAGLWLTQCTLFIAIESFEGYQVGFFGCLMQCAVALIAATVLIFFGALLERCEEISVVRGTYLSRDTNRLAVLYDRSFSLVPVIGLNEHRGVRRFQRPPPSL